MFFEEQRIAFHTELVSAEDVGHVVCFKEFVDDAGTERVPCPTVSYKQHATQAPVDGVLRTAVI